MALLSFRRLGLEDREAVLGPLSRGIYAGHDYLPMVFEQWLHDGRHMMIGAFEPDGRLVGLDTVSLFDEGRTVVFQAMRVLEDMRGKGVAKALSAYITDYVQRQLPQVRRLRISSQSHNTSSIQVHVKQGFASIYTEAAAFGAFVRGQAKAEGKEEPAAVRDPAIAHISAERLFQVLQDSPPAVRQQLIPHNHILVDWNPYEATLAQLQWVQATQATVFHAGFDAASGALQSFAAIQRCSRVSGLHLNITVRGQGSHAAFVAHVLEGVRTHGCGCSFVCLGYDQSLRDTLTGVDISRRDPRQPEAVLEIGRRAQPPIDFSVDFLNGSQIIMQLDV